MRPMAGLGPRPAIPFGGGLDAAREISRSSPLRQSFVAEASTTPLVGRLSNAEVGALNMASSSYGKRSLRTILIIVVATLVCTSVLVYALSAQNVQPFAYLQQEAKQQQVAQKAPDESKPEQAKAASSYAQGTGRAERQHPRVDDPYDHGRA